MVWRYMWQIHLRRSSVEKPPQFWYPGECRQCPLDILSLYPVSKPCDTDDQRAGHPKYPRPRRYVLPEESARLLAHAGSHFHPSVRDGCRGCLMLHANRRWAKEGYMHTRDAAAF